VSSGRKMSELLRASVVRISSSPHSLLSLWFISRTSVTHGFLDPISNLPHLSVRPQSLSLLLLRSLLTLSPPLNRTGDIFLGLGTGLFAYYLYEKKLNRSSKESLLGMLKWKIDQREKRRWKQGGKEGKEEIGWEELSKEIGNEEQTK